MIAALAVAVIVLAVVFFGGSSGHKYTLVFQNAGQLVPDNQVLIGGSPAGTVESIGLTDDNLAEVHVSVDQELHEGTTATIRATSLSGVANHYVSISPGPNSEPALDDGAELGPRLDHDADRHRPVLQHLPAAGAPGPAELHPRQRGDLLRPGQERQRLLQVLRQRAQPRRRLRPGTERRRAPALPLRRQLLAADHRGRRARRAALERDLQRQHRLRRDRPANRRLRRDPARACRRSSASRTRPSSTCAPRSTTSNRWSTPPSRRPRTWRRSSPNCGRSSRNWSRSRATCASSSTSPARRTTPPTCWRRCRRSRT